MRALPALLAPKPCNTISRSAHVYYGEINYYVPDVSLARARYSFGPVYLHLTVREVTHPRREDPRRRVPPLSNRETIRPIQVDRARNRAVL